MVGQRALRFLGLDGPRRQPLLSPAGEAVYLTVAAVAAALMLGGTVWSLGGGPTTRALPLFLVGLALAVGQIIWAGRRRRQQPG